MPLAFPLEGKSWGGLVEGRHLISCLLPSRPTSRSSHPIFTLESTGYNHGEHGELSRCRGRVLRFGKCLCGAHYTARPPGAAIIRGESSVELTLRTLATVVDIAWDCCLPITMPAKIGIPLGVACHELLRTETLPGVNVRCFCK